MDSSEVSTCYRPQLTLQLDVHSDALGSKSPISPPSATHPPPTRLPRVLFTGFGPFPGHPINPTELFLPIITAAFQAGKYLSICADFLTEVLQVEYATLPTRLSDFSIKHRCPDGTLPDIVVHFGLAPDIDSIQLEPIAKNLLENYPDNNGARQPGKVVHDPSLSVDHTIPSRLPNNAIYSELESRGIPVHLAAKPGDYACNFLFYLSASTSVLKACPGWMPETVGFVHVPDINEADGEGGGKGMSLEVLVEAAEGILKACCLDWLESRK